VRVRPYRELAEFYDRIYRPKDYRAEAEAVRKLAQRFGPRPQLRLLDVACGTGEHLRQLRKWYFVLGVDSSGAMIRLARAKLPGVPLRRAEMSQLRVAESVDVLTCLFSAIGYLPSEAALLRAFERFYRALRPGGIALIEPWLGPKEYHPGHMHLTEYRSREALIARMNVSSRRGAFSVMDMHYLIGDGRRVHHLVEPHQLRLTPTPRLLQLLRRAGFRARFRRRTWPGGRGLLLAVKPDPASA
jgi:SAM-dependent methyltransferase